MAVLPYAGQFCGDIFQRHYADEALFLCARRAAAQTGQPLPVLTAWGDERQLCPPPHCHQTQRRLPGITSRGVRGPL